MFQRTLVPAVISLMLATSAFAATHQVQQVGLTFVPDDLTIAVGDTVEWVHATASHSVTEGTDDLTPPIGSKLFDSPLSLAVPTFSFTFTQAGDVPYYCRPHRTLGMTGIIRVTQPTPAPYESTSMAWSGVKNLYR